MPISGWCGAELHFFPKNETKAYKGATEYARVNSCRNLVLRELLSARPKLSRSFIHDFFSFAVYDDSAFGEEDRRTRNHIMSIFGMKSTKEFYQWYDPLIERRGGAW